MRRFVLLALGLLLLSPVAFAGGKKKAKAADAATAATAASDDKEIHWMSWEDAQEAMKKTPKKIWIDMYTDWCGWCKKMDKSTYMNPNVIRYMNEHFYSVRFNPEKNDSVTFKGQRYHPMQFAAQLMGGNMSYPTGVYFDEQLTQPMPIPGYQDVPNMEMILKYLAEELYKRMPFPRYQQEFKATWGS